MQKYEKFGDVLHAKRESMGKSRFAIAKSAGISMSEMAELEEGRRYPRASTAKKLAKALGIDVALLIEALNENKDTE